MHTAFLFRNVALCINKYLCTLQAVLSSCGECGSKEQRAKSQGSPDLHYQIWGNSLSGFPSKLVSVVGAAVCPAVPHGSGISTLINSQTLHDFIPYTPLICKNFGQVPLTWPRAEVPCTQGELPWHWCFPSPLTHLEQLLLVSEVKSCEPGDAENSRVPSQFPVSGELYKHPKLP